MTETAGASDMARQRRARLFMAAVGVVSLIGAATTFYFYKKHADVWLRAPPKVPMCVAISRKLLKVDSPVSGSIPHVTPDGTMVYLRPAEDRVVRCMNRVASKLAPELAAALAEVDPDKRAKILVAMLRDHVPPGKPGDEAAVAAYLMASALFKEMPKTPEIEAIRAELDQANACRFPMRTPCPSRPPIPMIVWIAGVPSSIGITAFLGWIGKGLVNRIRTWREKRRQTKLAKVVDKEVAEPEEKKE